MPNQCLISNDTIVTLFQKYLLDIRSDGTTQNKLNVNAPEFTVNREVQGVQPLAFFTPNPQFIQHSKSSGNILAAARRHAAQFANISTPQMSGIHLQCSLTSNAVQMSVSSFLIRIVLYIHY